MALHDARLSKTLSWLLRHQAAKEGLDMSDDGYVPCHQVVTFLSNRCIPDMTHKKLLNEIHACPKRRLQLSQCGTYVRASHGHSIRNIDDARILEEVTDASTVIDAAYGIGHKQWETVRTAGLKCGTRNHLHISTRDSKSGYIIGKPGGDADVVVFINVARAIADGVKFYMASNGVILTRGVDEKGELPIRYFTRAVLHNQDGSESELLF